MGRLLLLGATLLGFHAHAPAQHAVPALRFELIAGHSQTECTRGVPDAWTVADWVYVNGQEIHSTTSSGSSLYFAGNGTLVSLTAVPHNGPICVRAMAWLPAAKVTITFRVLQTS